MSAPANRIALLGMEDDVRSLRELLFAIEALANHANRNGNGLDIDEVRGLYRLANHTAGIAGKVEAQWEQAIRQPGGSS